MYSGDWWWIGVTTLGGFVIGLIRLYPHFPETFSLFREVRRKPTCTQQSQLSQKNHRNTTNTTNTISTYFTRFETSTSTRPTLPWSS